MKNLVGYSRNLPAMPCFHNSARMLTARIHSSVIMNHKGIAAKSAHRVFYQEIDFMSIIHFQALFKQKFGESPKS